MIAKRPTDGRTKATAAPSGVRASARRSARVVQSVVLSVAAAVGLLVVLAALAPLAGFHLVRLETGSMSPGFPAGSVLLAQDIAARDAAVGDIVTVTRADGSPVTHRVVEVEPAGSGARLVLKGDANDQVDPAPYLATRVGRAVGGVPFAGGLVEALGGRLALPVLAAISSLLVLWAWWPSGRAPAHRASRARRPAIDGGGAS